MVVMPRQNPRDVIDEVHDALGAFYAGGDDEPVRKLLSADVEWHVPGRSSIAGDYYGAEAVLAYLLYRIRDGRIAACWLLPLDLEAFDSIWSGSTA